MASRSDELASHQFALRRVVGALAAHDANPTALPTRHIAGSLFAGVMIAVLALAGVAIYGLLRPGSDGTWRDGRATIIERESGARFIYVDGVLYPVLNHASAVLIVGTDATVLVPSGELLGVPRGEPVGIPGAPDPLPGRDHLLTDPWTVCARPTEPGGPAQSVLRVGWSPADSPASSPAGDAGVLVQGPDGDLHLVWHGHRYALSDPDLVLAAFTWDAASASPVPAAVLNQLAVGPDLAPVPTPRKAAGSAVPGLHVGEVFVVANADGGRLYGVALAEGVSTITAVQAALLVADGANGGELATPLSATAYAAAPKLGSLAQTGEDVPPEELPTQVRPGGRGGVCVTIAAGASLPTVAVTEALEPVPGEAPARADGAVGELADQIAVPPGRGVLVEALAGPGSAQGSLAVVTDLGLRFAVPTAQVAAMLGYGDASPVRLPAGLVALLPAGPALDPARAGLPVS